MVVVSDDYLTAFVFSIRLFPKITLLHSYTALLDLAEWGYIGSSTPENLLQCFTYQYHKTHPPKKLAMPMGTFFPRDILVQPQIYRFGNPLKNFLPFTLNDQTKWIPYDDWISYQDHNNNNCFRSDRYNIFFRQLAPFRYAN